MGSVVVRAGAGSWGKGLDVAFMSLFRWPFGSIPGCEIARTAYRPRAKRLAQEAQSALAVLTLTVKSYGPRLRPAGRLGGPTYPLVAAHRSPWRSTLATRFATGPDK